MADALGHLDEAYGGMDAYLLGPAGMRRKPSKSCEPG